MREKTIGIVGGGQLGRMLCAAAGRLGFETVILEPDKAAPAAQFANRHIVAGYDDNDALDALAGSCSVITYEFENIPVSSVAKLNLNSTVFPPQLALEKSQDRVHEKQFINDLGIATARYFAVDTLVQFHDAMAKMGGSAVLKTRRMGYDGKGQLRISSDGYEAQIGEIEALLRVECVVEAMVDFSCEISVIGARDKDGNCACYDAAQNTHENGILVASRTPDDVEPLILERARETTISILNGLEYVGVIGVEFFVGKNGDLLVNEFAPRVHNSGHWSEAACVISQFEQHIRAITGLPLGATARHSDFEMFNLIGDEIHQVEALTRRENVLVNVYGKEQVRVGRKMGHYTQISTLGGDR